MQGFPEALQVGMASHTRASRLRRQRPEALGAGGRKWGNPYRCQRLQRLGGDVAQHDGHGAAALPERASPRHDETHRGLYFIF